MLKSPQLEIKTLQWLHYVQLGLVVLLVGVGAARLSQGNPNGRPVSRSDIIVITGVSFSLSPRSPPACQSYHFP